MYSGEERSHFEHFACSTWNLCWSRINCIYQFIIYQLYISINWHDIRINPQFQFPRLLVEGIHISIPRIPHPWPKKQHGNICDWHQSSFFFFLHTRYSKSTGTYSNTIIKNLVKLYLIYQKLCSAEKCKFNKFRFKINILKIKRYIIWLLLKRLITIPRGVKMRFMYVSIFSSTQSLRHAI